jgi:hypothetical protein
MSEQDSLVNQAVRTAVASRGPVEVDIAQGGWLVVHPQADFVMVSVGQQSTTDPMELLRRRWRSPERFGLWMPAVLKDDQAIVVMRLERHANGDVALFDDGALDSAREFLT